VTKSLQADQLLVIRLNNFAGIAAAFGQDAALGAMEYLRRGAERHLGRIELRRMERDEIELLTAYPRMRCLPPGTLVDTLCGTLSADAFRFGDADILLSVSVGYGPAARGGEEAGVRLAASCLQEVRMVGRSAEWVARYRKDMEIAAGLVIRMRRGPVFPAWRRVSRTDGQGTILYHEAVLREAGDSGVALERLGLAHLLDRMMVTQVLEELEADPAACLCVPVASQNLSLNLHGEEAGWSDLLARLRRDPDLARRLVIEITDNSPLPRFHDALAFVRALRGLGVRLSVARFGSGHASIGQLTALSPDVVKIDGAFLRAAHRSERDRRRIGHLIELARTISPTVIVDGVDSSWHLQLAREESAQWIAGSHVGQPSLRRGWLDVRYGDSVASLAAFNSSLHRPDARRVGGSLRHAMRICAEMDPSGRA
jgi:EAL domain-containing protein (putative c-di-GMP-specific phosphodiesterase class I)